MFWPNKYEYVLKLGSWPLSLAWLWQKTAQSAVDLRSIYCNYIEENKICSIITITRLYLTFPCWIITILITRLKAKLFSVPDFAVIIDPYWWWSLFPLHWYFQIISGFPCPREKHPRHQSDRTDQLHRSEDHKEVTTGQKFVWKVDPRGGSCRESCVVMDNSSRLTSFINTRCFIGYASTDALSGNWLYPYPYPLHKHGSAKQLDKIVGTQTETELTQGEWGSENASCAPVVALKHP